MFGLGTIRTRAGTTAVAIREGRVHDVSMMLDRWVPDVAALMPDWDAALDAIESGLDNPTIPLLSGMPEYLCPVPAPRKVICIGINYRDHIDEMGVAPPDFPYAFLRPATCLTPHGAPVTLPHGPTMIDWEAELGVVIGRRARDLTPETALSAVAGYTIVNDVSARDWIEKAPFVGIDWVMQKGWDGFQPTGPVLVPARFIPDPQALDLELEVNGIIKQQQSTAKMVFTVAEILCHLSRIMTLEPGDIIATGTPAGVGFGRRPREFLSDGDEVAVRIAGLGELRNRFIRAA